MSQDLRALTSQAGCDPEAFTALYDRYFAAVYNYIRYRVDETAAVEDLTAQVFERALTSIGRYAPDQAPFEAWLFGIVRHVVGDTLRRARFSAWLPWEAFLNRAAPDPLPEEVTTERDLEARLAHALPKLKSRERDLIGLKYAGGLTNRQIAGLVGLSEQNVGITLFRAIEKLVGYELPAPLWESEILPARVPDYKVATCNRSIRSQQRAVWLPLFVRQRL